MQRAESPPGHCLLLPLSRTNCSSLRLRNRVDALRRPVRRSGPGGVVKAQRGRRLRPALARPSAEDTLLIPYGGHNHQHAAREGEDWSGDMASWRHDWRISRPRPAGEADWWGLVPLPLSAPPASAWRPRSRSWRTSPTPNKDANATAAASPATTHSTPPSAAVRPSNYSCPPPTKPEANQHPRTRP